MLVGPSESLATLTLDAGGRVRTWSEGGERVEGYRAEEIVGKHFSVLYPPDEVEAGTPERALAVAAEKGLYQEDGWRVRKDGSRFWAHVEVTRFESDAGERVSYARTAQDPTEQPRAEEARRILDTVYAAMDAIITLDDEQRVVLFNPAAEKIFGRPAAGVLGKPIDQLIPARFRAGHREHVRRFGESGATQRSMGSLGMIFGLRASGEEFPIEASISATRSDGRLSYTVIMRDVTERVRSEEELRRAKAELESLAEALRDADRRKDDFLAMLAHELRNPLTPIVNATQLLGTGARDPANAARLLGIIARQTTRMAKLIDDLLDTSRIVRGRVTLQRSIVDLRDVIEAAIEAVKPLMQARQHLVGVSVPDECLAVDADAMRLEQVLVNLLNNAAKYTDPGGQISIHADRAGGDVVVRVRDTGRGIPAEILPRVFDLFTQGPQPSDRMIGGLGIGLTIARGIVEMHGGVVEARSDGPGKGSELVVRLPGAATAPVAAARAAPRPADAEGESCRVLVVEDNPETAETLCDLLRTWGHEVRHAGDGPTALASAREFGPDLVLLDIGLPGMDGYEVAREMRRVPEGQATRIVAVTGYGQEQDRLRSVDAGIDEHLVKPVPPPTLRAAAARACRARA